MKVQQPNEILKGKKSIENEMVLQEYKEPAGKYNERTKDEDWYLFIYLFHEIRRKGERI